MPPRSAERCVIEPDIDVIGIGIRASLYTLSLSCHLSKVAFSSPELTNAIQASLGVTGLALFLSTVIATARGVIGFFHVLCVFHLLGIVGVAARPRGRYAASVVKTYTFSAFYAFVSVSSLVYLIYVFATAPTFGKRAECNGRTVYVLFGVDIPATSPALRWTFVAILGVMLLGLSLWLLIVGCMSLDAILRRDEPVRTDWQREDVDGEERTSQLYGVVGCVAGTVYLAVMTELMIKRNNVADGVNEWAFGQVLAITMLLAPLIELGSLLLARVNGRDIEQQDREFTLARRRM